MLLFVDDYILTQDELVLPISATIIVLLCRIFHIPVSWKKCVLALTVSWIGWIFNFHAGLVILHPDKQQKLLKLVRELLQHSRTSKKLFERFLGLSLWCTSLFPALKVHLHWLYSDLSSIPATQYSVSPANWDTIRPCLTPRLVFHTSPTDTSIPINSTLVSVKHREVSCLEDLDRIPITDRRVWMRIRSPTSSSRKLCPSSIRVLKLFEQWLLPGTPILSMRPRSRAPLHLAADAFAHGELSGFGGFVQLPEGRTVWFPNGFRSPTFSL